MAKGIKCALSSRISADVVRALSRLAPDDCKDIEPSLANQIFAFGVQHTNNSIVAQALQLGADVETLVCNNPPLFYLAGVNAIDVPGAQNVADTLLQNGASLTKFDTIAFYGMTFERNALTLADTFPNGNAGEMSKYYAQYQQTHAAPHAAPHVGDEGSHDCGAAAGAVSSGAPGGPHITEEDSRECAGHDPDYV